MEHDQPLRYVPAAGPRKRDIRIDFFRGLALYMILVDHIYLNPLSKLTYHSFGFSDSAEIFIFLSGLSCGIAYNSLLVRQGLMALIGVLSNRAIQIYFYYALSSILTLLIVRAVGDAVADKSHFGLIDTTSSAIKSIILFKEQPPLPSVLVLYLVLTLFVVPVFLVVARRSASAALAISLLIWVIPQLFAAEFHFGVLFPFFNPMAWQLLFAIGMFLGMSYESEQPWAFLQRWSAPLIAIAWAIVLLSLAYKSTFFVVKSAAANLDFLHFYDTSDYHFKYNLSIVRLVHFLSVAFLVRTYITPANAFLVRHGSILITTGRWSLQIFSISAVLSVVVTAIFAIYHCTIVEKLALNALAVLLTALTAIVLSALKGPASPGGLAGKPSAR